MHRTAAQKAQKIQNKTEAEVQQIPTLKQAQEALNGLMRAIIAVVYQLIYTPSPHHHLRGDGECILTQSTGVLIV